MTEPTRPTDAELEAGHARLLGLDYDFTVASEETFRAQVLGRTVREQTPPETPEYLDIERWVGAATLRLWPLSGHVLRLPKANKEPTK